MKLWVLSDVHLELSPGWDLPPAEERPDFDVLVVAGDLVPGMEVGVEWLRERVTQPIIYVAGNHEAWHRDIDRNLAKGRAAARATNVHVLQNNAVEIDGVRFIGATLWCNFDLFGNPALAMNVALQGMRDYRRIRKENYGHRLRPIDTLARHLESLALIESELSRPYDGKNVVVTHHAPVREAVAAGHENDVISASYVSDLRSTIEKLAPDIWVYGHVHESRDLMIGRTRVVSNPKGYGALPENRNFDRHFVIEV